MSGPAGRCDDCMRMLHDVQRCALLVSGQLRIERSLCPACRTNALDGFLLAADGTPLPAKALR